MTSWINSRRKSEINQKVLSEVNFSATLYIKILSTHSRWEKLSRHILVFQKEIIQFFLISRLNVIQFLICFCFDACTMHLLLFLFQPTNAQIYITYNKVKWSRYRPGVAQRMGRGIALLFHDGGNRGGEWSAARPGRTLPPGKTRYPFYRSLGGSQGRFGRVENLVPTGIRSRTVQPVVSRYTDWATRPTYYLQYNIYLSNLYK